MLPDVRAVILNARNRMVPRDVAKRASRNLDIGDWWLIYMLGRNLDPIVFKDVLTDFVKDVPSKREERD